MQVMVREGYAFYWLGVNRLGGDIVDIPENDYKGREHIFESPEWTQKVIAERAKIKSEESEAEPPEDSAEGAESKEPTEDVEDKDVAMDTVENRAIVKPQTVKNGKAKKNGRKTHGV